MLKRVAVLLLFTVVLVLAFSSTALAAQVDFNPILVEEVTVHAADDVTFHTGWMAGTRASTLQWRQSCYVEAALRVDGGDELFAIDRDAAQAYFGPIAQATGFVFFNGKIRAPAYGCFWSYHVGSLPAGEYVLSFANGWNVKAPDLGDYNGDGKPDVGANVQDFDLELAIHVVP